MESRPVDSATRPRRQTKKLSRSDDFLDNYDAELDAIESLPSSSVRTLAAPPTGGVRKRGRPRKYPPAPPPPIDLQPVKRPRGRPRGSGKHQKAAAAAAALAIASGMGLESGVASVALSSAPSADLALPSGAYDTLIPPGIAVTPRTVGSIPVPHENGTQTPHYPPRSDPIPSSSSDAPRQNGVPPEVKTDLKVAIGNGNGATAGSSAFLPAETPTPRPRNRRKCAAPTKTE